MTNLTYLVIGAGQAGGWSAMTLRKLGFEGRVVLIGEEAHVPYERPPLSKTVLSGESDLETTYLRNAGFYQAERIELRLGTRVAAIDRGALRVELEAGESLGYDKLLLATGSRVRKLSLPGTDLPGIHYLRNIDDMIAIRAELKPDARLVVVGGGYIGLEVAATARKLGCQVTVLEAQDAVMNRVVAPDISRFYADVHEQRGVQIHTGITLSHFEGKEHVTHVVCADATAYATDLVVVGVGILPNGELAQAAGLEVDDGVVTDEYGRTSDARIFAAGDVTNHWNPLLGRRLRLESWQNAQNQAIAAATTMHGELTPYADVPWFWSDQFDLNLQMVGLPERWDDVVFRGALEERQFSAFYLMNGAVVGAIAVNNPRDVHPARKLIESGNRLDRERLAHEERLKKLL